MWGTVTSTSASNDDVKLAYQDKVDALKTWLSSRLDWLYTAINNLNIITFSLLCIFKN